MESSRRGFFKLLAALGAAPVLDRVVALLPEETAWRIGIASHPPSSLMAELSAITRRVCIPALYKQVYDANPLLKLLQDSAVGRGYHAGV